MGVVGRSNLPVPRRYGSDGDKDGYGNIRKSYGLVERRKGEGQGQGEEAGDADSGNSNSSGDGSNGTGRPDTGISTAKARKHRRRTQVINGKTYYGDVFEDAYREMLERMKNNNSLSEAEKKAISDYLDSIRK